MRKNLGPLFVLCSAVLMSFGGLMIKAIPWGAMAVNGGRNLVAAGFTLAGIYLSGGRLKTNRAVLIENHGAVTWAETVRQAYYNMEFLEKCCKIYAVANFMIGGAHDIPNEESIREQLAAFQKDAMGG